MKEILQKYLTVLRKDRNRQMKLMGVLTVLSVMVVVAVAWQLRFVGIAKTDEPSCGMEEHVHTEACIRRKLICNLKEGEPEPSTAPSEVVHHHGPECYEETKTLHCTEKEHVHTDKCYEIKKILDCTKEEHVHTPACYQIQDILVCTEDHEHTSDCYEQRKVPICGKEAHTHNDDCYRIERNLICGEKEHTHGDSCYTVEKKLICGMEEGQILETAPAADSEPKLHVHTDDCYEITYICGKEEHKHTLACYSNPDMDVESYQDWEKTFPKEWGKTWNENVLLMAQSQMGYKESEVNFQIGEDGESKKGYTRYGGWYGNPYGDWNTMFVSFCLNNAGIPFEAVPKSGGAFALCAELKKMDLYEEATYMPKPGDVVFIKDEGQKNVNRTAIVAALGDMIVDDQKVPCITVIEGDLNNAVAPYKYAVDDVTIDGYLSVAAAYDRAVEMGLFLEDEMEVTPETTAATDATEGRELTDEELDAKLAVVLDNFSKKAEEFLKVDRRGSEKSAKAIRQQMDELFLKLQECHGLRYPNAGEADFVKYMKLKAEDAYNAYTLACQKYPANEAQKPANKPERLNADAVNLLKTLTDKAVAFEAAAAEENAAEIRSLGKEMNLLYDQALSLYLQQYTEKTEKDFEWYLEKNYTKASEMMKEAESRLHIRALDDMLKGKLTAFAEKAKQCAMAMNIADKSAESLKLDLDQLYLELKDLHAQRYPDAKEEDFDIYLKNYDAKSVERYLSAVKTFPNVNLNSNITLSQPEKGELTKGFVLSDGMEVDISITGSICFPVMEKAAEKLNAQKETANLETISKEGTAPENSTQEAAANPDANINTLELDPEAQNSDADIQTADEPAEPDRWSDIQVKLEPVSEDNEMAFAEYISQYHPDTLGMTMMNFRYQYNGIDLNMSGADITMSVKPSEQSLNPTPMISTMMVGQEGSSTGPVIQHAEVVDTVSPAVKNGSIQNHSAKILNNALNAEKKMVTVLQNQNGKISTVASFETTGDEVSPTILLAKAGTSFDGNTAIIAENVTPDRKPIKDSDFYPTKWGEKAPDKLTLVTDPYLKYMAEHYPADDKTLVGFEEPSYTLGYILRNYNAFVFNDLVAKHVIGSVAVQKDAYYMEPQGGTGAGDKQNQPMPNYAPTFYNGKIFNLKSYQDPDDKLATDTDALSMKVWVEQNNDLPSYVSTKTKDKGESNGHKQCTLQPPTNQYYMQQHPDDPQISVNSQTPWYYSDSYINFAECLTQIHSKIDTMSNAKVVMPPIVDEATNRDDLSAAQTSANFNACDTWKTSKYRWQKIAKDGVRPVYQLFLQIGNVYDLDDAIFQLTYDKTKPIRIQIVLCPPDHYTFKNPINGDPKVRATELALLLYNTVIYSDYTGTIDLENQLPTLKYYYDTIEESFVKEHVDDISLVTKVGYTNSTLLLFPKAARVDIAKMVGHVVAPSGTIAITSSGDYYGCLVCNDLHSAGDIHPLPYNGNGTNVPVPQEVEKLSKRIQSFDGSLGLPDKDDVFEFEARTVKVVRKNSTGNVIQTLEAAPDPSHNGEMYINGIPAQVFKGKNVGSKIVFDEFHFAKNNASFGNKNGTLDFPLKMLQDGYASIANESLDVTYEISETNSGDLQGDTRKFKLEVSYDIITKEVTKDPGKQYLDSTFKNYVLYKASGTPCSNDEGIVFVNREEKGGPELPHTGGIGTAPFVILGVVTLIGAAAYVVGQKRKLYQ